MVDTLHSGKSWNAYPIIIHIPLACCVYLKCLFGFHEMFNSLWIKLLLLFQVGRNIIVKIHKNIAKKKISIEFWNYLWMRLTKYDSYWKTINNQYCIWNRTSVTTLLDFIRCQTMLESMKICLPATLVRLYKIIRLLTSSQKSINGIWLFGFTSSVFYDIRRRCGPRQNNIMFDISMYIVSLKLKLITMN